MNDDETTEAPAVALQASGPTSVVRERLVWRGAAFIQLQGLVKVSTLRDLFGRMANVERALIDLRQALLLLSHVDWLTLAEQEPGASLDKPIGFLLRDEDVDAALAYRDAMFYRRTRRFCFTSRESSAALAWAGLPPWAEQGQSLEDVGAEPETLRTRL